MVLNKSDISLERPTHYLHVPEVLYYRYYCTMIAREIARSAALYITRTHCSAAVEFVQGNR
eukprot:COSAG02_NODE_435_length_22393_cov_18.805643_16_plen_61_part_00